MAVTHGGHGGSMHKGKLKAAAKTGSHYSKSATGTVTVKGKRPSSRSLNPSAMKKPRGA